MWIAKNKKHKVMLRESAIFTAGLAIAIMAFPALASPTNVKDAPIEISANDLVLDQQHSTATFTGDVLAVQEKYTLKSQKMVVHYRQKTPHQQKNASAISKIEVYGNVQLLSPDEKAVGDSGIYDVASNMLQLNGKVAITKDNNMVQGNKLVYNLETGKSTLTGGSSVTGGDGIAKTPSGRVKGVFIPNE